MSSPPDAEIVKACCATAYASDWATALLGDSMHPGGDVLTERLGTLLGLSTGDQVLDVASGRGRSAIVLAHRFGCRVTGIDYSDVAIAAAESAAEAAGLRQLVRFQAADAEAIPFPDGSFSGAICECAFCTFPSKEAAAAELARTLRPGGAVALSDITRRATLPAELDGLLSWVACVGDARPEEEYARLLGEAGLRVEVIERHDAALAELVGKIRLRLLGAEVAAGVMELPLRGVDWAAARRMAAVAAAAVHDGSLGYAVVVARRPVT